jgi:hypothetical protein
MTTTSGLSPLAVPERAIRGGETCEAMAPHQEWSWVEPWVWTARMLAALDARVKGGKCAFFAEHGRSACKTPMHWFASPLAGKTIDWRAGCGRSARPVRREGGSNPIGSPYPYQGRRSDLGPLDSRFRGNDGWCVGEHGNFESGS